MYCAADCQPCQPIVPVLFIEKPELSWELTCDEFFIIYQNMIYSRTVFFWVIVPDVIFAPLSHYLKFNSFIKYSVLLKNFLNILFTFYRLASESFCQSQVGIFTTSVASHTIIYECKPLQHSPSPCGLSLFLHSRLLLHLSLKSFFIQVSQLHQHYLWYLIFVVTGNRLLKNYFTLYFGNLCLSWV